MYPTSDKYKQAIKSHFREGGNIIMEFSKVTYEKRWVRSVNFSHLLNDSEYFTLGSTASKKVDITLNDIDGSLRNTVLSAEYFNLTFEFVGENVPIGCFRVDGDPDRSEKNIVKITAFDRLYYTNKKYYCMLGASYTAKDLLQDALAQCELELARVEILDSINYDIRQTFVPENVTIRQIISYCAELAGCMAVMTRDDKLDFIPIVNSMSTVAYLDIGNCYDMTFAETDYVVDGMRYYESDDSYLKSGSGKKRIVCLSSSNFLINQKTLNNIYERMKGLSFRPFKCPRYDGDPSLDACDMLSITSLDGTRSYKIMPTVLTWSYNGGLQGTLENTASTSATVEPKNVTPLDQKVNQTYYEKAGITYAYNTDKVILGVRETTLCDIKFANSYGNVPTGAIGLSGTFTPVDDVTPADVTMRFVADEEELPYHPVQHMTHAGKHVIYVPLVMYMLSSGDHYFQAYASISTGSFAIDAEQFTLHVLTIGTGGGVKSPDTYLSAVIGRLTLDPISIPQMSVTGFTAIPTVLPQEPQDAVIRHSFSLVLDAVSMPTLTLNPLRAGVNEKRIIYADTVAFNYMTVSLFDYDRRYISAGETSFAVVTDYLQDTVTNTAIDSGKVDTLEVDLEQYKRVEELQFMEVRNG